MQEAEEERVALQDLVESVPAHCRRVGTGSSLMSHSIILFTIQDLSLLLSFITSLFTIAKW